jgi:hypothetical protein
MVANSLFPAMLAQLCLVHKQRKSMNAIPNENSRRFP